MISDPWKVNSCITPMPDWMSKGQRRERWYWGCRCSPQKPVVKELELRIQYESWGSNVPRFTGQNSGAKSAGEERESGMNRGRERRERIWVREWMSLLLVHSWWNSNRNHAQTPVENFKTVGLASQFTQHSVDTESRRRKAKSNQTKQQ